MRAARGVWFLEYYGHPNVKMLDGGFTRMARSRRAGHHGSHGA